MSKSTKHKSLSDVRSHARGGDANTKPQQENNNQQKQEMISAEEHGLAGAGTPNEAQSETTPVKNAVPDEIQQSAGMKIETQTKGIMKDDTTINANPPYGERPPKDMSKEPNGDEHAAQKAPKGPANGQRNNLVVHTYRRGRDLLIELSYTKVQAFLNELRDALSAQDSHSVDMAILFRNSKAPLSPALLTVGPVAELMNDAKHYHGVIKLKDATALMQRLAAALEHIDQKGAPAHVYKGILITLEDGRIVTDTLVGGVPIQAFEITCPLSGFVDPVTAVYIGGGEFQLQRRDGTILPRLDVVFKFEQGSNPLRFGLYQKTRGLWVNVGPQQHHPGCSPAECGELCCNQDWFKEFEATVMQWAPQLCQVMSDAEGENARALIPGQRIDLGDEKFLRLPTPQEIAEGHDNCLVVEMPLPDSL